MQMLLQTPIPEAAARFVSFVNASPTPFHAVYNAAIRLEKAGFRKVITLYDSLAKSKIIIDQGKG